jgi:HSP20 family molecular chaperone IbpA
VSKVPKSAKKEVFFMATKEMTVKEKKALEEGAKESTRPGRVFVPAVDILENEEEIIILADMPGVTSKSVDIDLRESVLTIQGRISPAEGEKEVTVYREFDWGDYLRQFTLSDAIDQKKITAKMDQGVLRLTLPKAEKRKPQKIQVTVG